MASILFYRRNEAYGCFSNFSEHPVMIDGKTWPTTEHYFQAQKFAGTPDEEELRLAESPREVARMGRDRTRPLRGDWEEAKEAIMLVALTAKFTQHQGARQILLSTGDAVLVEYTGNDRYWADGGDGTGLNRLGQLLMQLRNAMPEHSTVFLLPPWLAYPGVHPSDMFWRMGAGENYGLKLFEWHRDLPEAARDEWRRYFRPPPDWAGYHDE